MTVTRALFTIVLATAMFAGGGAALGAVVGKVAPDYYEAVLARSSDPDKPGPAEVTLSPVQVGLGLGATQGAALGLVAGLVVVVAVAWSSSRARKTGSAA